MTSSQQTTFKFCRTMSPEDECSGPTLHTTGRIGVPPASRGSVFVTSSKLTKTLVAIRLGGEN